MGKRGENMGRRRGSSKVSFVRQIENVRTMGLAKNLKLYISKYRV